MNISASERSFSCRAGSPTPPQVSFRAEARRGRRPRPTCEYPVSAPGAFTLVEVLVALCIFAMAAVVLGSAYINVLNGYQVMARGMEVNEDFAFARQQVLNEPDRKKLEQGGEFDTASGSHARWSVDIESSTVADVYKVTFTCEISDPNRTEPDKQTQTFMLLRPTWVIDPGERGKLKEDAKTRIMELQGKLREAQGLPAQPTPGASPAPTRPQMPPQPR